jgi:hypothetical protein
MALFGEGSKFRQRRIDRKALKRTEGLESGNVPMGSKKYERRQNRINRLSGDDFRYDTVGNSPYQQSNVGPPLSDQSSIGDTSQLDPSSHSDVLALQQQLFPDDQSQWDGQFGPKTEEAYQQWNTENRGIEYDNPLQQAAGNDGLYGLSAPDTEWQDKNFGQKVATSLPGVGGNPSVREFWGSKMPWNKK